MPQFLPKNCLWLQSDAVLAVSVSILNRFRESGHYPKGADLRFLEVYFAFLQAVFGNSCVQESIGTKMASNYHFMIIIL